MKTRRKSGFVALRLASCALFVVMVNAAVAQVTPPGLGGASVDELQHGVQPRQVGGLPTNDAAPAAKSQHDESPADDFTPPIEIKGFRLTGETVFEEALLLKVANAVPGDYTFRQIQEIANRIKLYYREHGYLVADTIVPAQESRDGVIHIRVVEGRLEGQPTVSSSDSSVDNAIHNIYAAAVCANVPIDSATQTCGGDLATSGLIERVVLLARENTGYEVYAELSPGGEPGYTHMALNATPGRKVAGEVVFDNYGGEATGVWRGQGHVVARSLLTTGDILDGIGGLSNKPTRYQFFQIDYSAPVGAKGWRAGVNFGQTNYSLSGSFSALRATGTSRSIGIYARYPLVLRSDLRTDVTVSLKGGQLRDDNALFENPRLYWTASADLAGRIDDTWIGSPAVSLWGIRVDHGSVRITDMVQQALDNYFLHTAGSFNRITVRGSREQALIGSLSMFAGVTALVGDKNLDPYFKFSLGGPYAVRAYPSGEASGDQGVLGSIELRYALPPVSVFDHTLGARVSAFYDTGWVRNNRYPYPGVVNNTSLRSGAGLQVELTDAQLFSLRVFWATAVGSGASTNDGARSRVGVMVSGAF
ncbi:ShlB/FhaC/HecB family hemolysin secretion/activation protein [Pandoraea sp. NPDC090278]|uniref:ShlB/FhaC/HecB family hemolysin secretion/activation protein n=1 Tax=Pandoraea sp. NPDC090278 TaxID=3364391 RepID=UPI00383ABC40